MTPQQERIQQAQHHEFLADLWTAQIKKHKSPTGSRARRLAAYYKRTARQNRRAYERNSH